MKFICNFLCCEGDVHNFTPKWNENKFLKIWAFFPAGLSQFPIDSIPWGRLKIFVLCKHRGLLILLSQITLQGCSPSARMFCLWQPKWLLGCCPPPCCIIKWSMSSEWGAQIKTSPSPQEQKSSYWWTAVGVWKRWWSSCQSLPGTIWWSQISQNHLFFSWNLVL